MTGSLDWPRRLDEYEAQSRRESELDDLYRQQAETEHRCETAAAAMKAAEASGDDDAWDRAAAEHDQCSDDLGPIKQRIEEIEYRQHRADERSLRAWYQWASR